MSRYSIILKKELSPDKQIAHEEVAQGVQTSKRGSNIMICGPNGYKVFIPIRFVSIHNTKDGRELHLTLPESVARDLNKDIHSAQNLSTSPSTSYRQRHRIMRYPDFPTPIGRDIE
jgi:hypothetical protein